MGHIAFIPARAGSKRLKDKNLAQIRGHTLVEIAIQDAQRSGLFDSIIVSTDSDDIARLATLAGVKCHVRPAHLASDTAETIDVVRDYVQGTAAKYETLTLLQPTSPLRTPEDIQSALACLTSPYEAVVSVGDAAFPDIVYLRGETGRLIPLALDHDAVKPNGAIYIIRWPQLVQGKDWWSVRAYAYRMGKMASVDIDTADDLEEARTYWKAVRGT